MLELQAEFLLCMEDRRLKMTYRIYDNGTYRDMTAEEIAELENQSSGGG